MVHDRCPPSAGRGSGDRRRHRRHVGYHALNSLRIEKAYRDWDHDITDEDTTLESGLGFAVARDKPGGFTGRDALLRQRDAGVTGRLVTFVLDDPDPLLYHNEPIWRDGKLVGKTTSGMFGHTIGRSIGLGWVAGGEQSNGALLGSRYELEVADGALSGHAPPPPSLRSDRRPDPSLRVSRR